MFKKQNRSASPRLRGELFFVAVLVLATSVAFAQSAPAHPELLVSTSWLADHLKDPDVVVVQIGRNDETYRKQHIPGARFLPVSQIASSEHPGTELLPAGDLKKNLEAIGLSDSSHIVIYTTDYDPVAARLFFTLDYLGLGSHASLLDGSITEWLAEHRPVSAEAPAVTRGKLTIQEHPEVVAKMDWVSKVTAHPAAPVAFIDARPTSRYEAGHLPGAMPMYWLGTQEAHLLRSPDDLRQMFTRAGATSGKKMVSYCEVGQQASYVYFVARYLGIDAAMYDGSYMEWSSSDKPSVKGTAPR
jgi:thiosulfate/3-mercaptopyruvate sulfurtransferase